MERRPSSSALASYVNPNYIAAFFHNHCANHHVLNSGGVSSTGSGPPTSPFFVPTPPSSAPPTGRPTYFNYDMVDQSFFTSSSPLSTTGLMISSQQPTQSSSSSPSSHPVTSSPPTLRSHHHHHHLPGHPISPTLSPFTSPLRHGSSLSHLSINYIASQSSTLSGSIVNAAAAAAAAAANASIGPQNSINSTIKSPTQQLTFNLTPPNSCENLHTSGWVFESIGSSTDQPQHQHQQQHPHSLVAARSSSGEESLRMARNNEFLSDWPRSTGSKDLRRENSDINSNIDEKRAKHTLGETDNLIGDQVFKFKPVDSNNSLAFRPHNIISSGNDKNNNNITRCESPSSSSATTSPSMMNQNCSSPSHVPKGKEGSRKHRILRPPDIQIDHRSRESLHSVAGKELAPMSAPPFDSIRDIQRSRFPYSPVPLTSETSDGGSKNTSQHIVPSVANTLARRKEADDAAIISQNSSTFSPSFCHKNRSKPEKLPHSPRVNGHPAKPKSRNQGTINTPRTTSCSAQSTKTSNQGGNILSRSRKVHVQFQKGSLIQLGDGRKKPIEEMVTQDFFRSALLSPNLSIDSSRIVALKENIENCSIWITFEMRNSDSPEIQDQSSSSSRNFHPMTTTPAVQISGPSTRYYTIEAPMEHPFFVHERGWCSFSPHQTLLVYGLECKKLGEGDTCLSLVRKTHHHQLKKNPLSSREPQRTITSSPKRDQVSSNQQNQVLSQAQLTQPAHHQGMLGNSHAGHETQSPKDYQQKEVQDLSITGNRDSPSQQEQQRPSPSVLPQVVRSPQPENDPPSDEKSLLNSINKKRRHSAPDVVSEKMTTVVDDNSGKSIAEADSNSPSIKDSRQTVDSKGKEKEEEEEDEIEVEGEEGKEKDELHHERKRKA